MSNGNRLTVKDAENKTWAFAYDDLGRLTSETDHSSRTTSYKPDEAGNVYEKTNRLTETTRTTYDLGNRPTRVDYLKDSTAETFGYDPAGNLNAAANGTVSYSFTWDRLNRLTQKSDGRGKNLSFSFDKVGNILTKTTYQGSTTRYTYNAANRLTMLQNPDYTQVDYQYDPAGRLLSKVTANGARMTQTFDANGWPTRLTQYDAANALISDTGYTRDRTGNILTQTDAAGTTTYAYDPLYRLKTADYPSTANDELFTYDKVGNRKTATKGSLTQNSNTRYYTYTTGTNRLANIRIGSTSGTIESSFAHDFEGRLTSQTGLNAKTLTWDAKGRVRTVGAETYSYDPMDYRIKRSGGSLGSLDYFLEGEHLESVYSGTNLYAKYFRGSSTDELVAGYLYDTDSKLKPFLFHHDHNNSTAAISGHNGGTLQSTSFSAFGSTQSSTGTSPNRLKYTGREDDGTGLYYYRARYYDPSIGRFISEDPLGFQAGDVNFYQYTSNNPVNANDPSGNVKKAIESGVELTLWVKDTWNKAQILAAQQKADALNALAVNGKLAKTQVNQGPSASSIWSAAGKSKPAGVDIDHIQDKQLGRTNALANLSPLDSSVNRSFGAQIASQLRSHPIGTTVTAVGLFLSETAKAASNITFEGVGGFLFDASPLGDIWDAVKIKGLGGCSNGVCSDMISPQFRSSSSFGPAGGGFLLYPNKANTNMMQSVYSK